MTLRLVVAPRAERDLDEIAAYISEDSTVAALKVLQQIERTVDRLLERPFLGPPVSLSKWPGLRKMTSAPYIVFYRLSDSELEIARVLHSSRDLDAIWAAE